MKILGLFNLKMGFLFAFCTLFIWSGCGDKVGSDENLLPEFAQPQNFEISAESNKAVLSWTAVIGADGYAVELFKGESTSVVVAKSDTITESTYTFDNLESSTVYTAQIRAISLRSASQTSKSLTKSFTTLAPSKEDLVPDLVVAKDGSGDFTTVQAAINAVPVNSPATVFVYVKKGEYKELVEVPQNKPNVYLIGEDKSSTIITFDNHSGKEKPDGGTFGTADSRSVYVRGDNFYAENITFANTAGMNAGQALAIYVASPKSAFKNCRFLGFQDTYYAHENTVQYIVDSYIEGSVDFMFGGSTTLFENCEIQSNRTGGYITAASTPEGKEYGYVFKNCRLTAASGVNDGTVYLGRPWRPFANVVFINCELGKHIRAEGWHNWNDPANEKTAFYAESGSIGAGANAQQRVSWSKQLSEADVVKYSKSNILSGWTPGLLPDQIRIVIQ